MPEDSITTYRQTSKLRERAWQDEQVQSWVSALSLMLKHAVVAGSIVRANDIATLLAACEPLEQHTAQDREGHLLRLAYLHYVGRDSIALLQVVAQTCRRYPEDAYVQRLCQRLRSFYGAS
jgi:hypothetical protein